MTLRWFVSKTVRHAVAMRKHVHRILCAQRDILTPQAIDGIKAAIGELNAAVSSNATQSALKDQMDKLEKAANKWLKPYPNAAFRENIEVFLVALAVAMAIRTFFLQPFKIPTGSMQPTLFGVTSVPDFSRINFAQGERSQVQAEITEQVKLRNTMEIPTGWERIKEWFEGVSYIDFKAKADGTVTVGNPVGIKVLNFWQTISIGGVAHTIWFPPDYGSVTLNQRVGIPDGRFFHKGDQVIRLKTRAGDHLFVDRLTYNFCKPKRGEIIVFQTAGIQDARMPQDQFYIKRLVALGGERVQIGNDRHLIINGRRLDASTPHFENVYGFDPKEPPQESQFSGHLNEVVANSIGRVLAPLFPDESTVYEVQPADYMVMGDNTVNSFDSRAWGEFPAANVIGKSFFVYWPITSRFGWGNH